MPTKYRIDGIPQLANLAFEDPGKALKFAQDYMAMQQENERVGREKEAQQEIRQVQQRAASGDSGPDMSTAPATSPATQPVPEVPDTSNMRLGALDARGNGQGLQMPEMRAALPEGFDADTPTATGVGQSARGLFEQDDEEIQRLRSQFGGTEAFGQYEKQQKDEVTNRALSQLAYQLEESEDPQERRLAQILNVYRNTGKLDDATEMLGEITGQQLDIGKKSAEQEGSFRFGEMAEDAGLGRDKELHKFKQDYDFGLEQKKKALEAADSDFSEKEQGAVRSFLGRVDGDMIVKRATQSVSAARPIMNVLELKNPVADEALKVLIPRLMGEVGNLSQAEQQAYGGSQAIFDKLGQTVERAKTGQLSEDNRRYLWDLATTMYNSSASTLSRRLDQMIPQEVQLSGVDEEQLRNVVGTYTQFDNFAAGDYPWSKGGEGNRGGSRKSSPATADPIEQLKELARSGDKTAQDGLRKRGISW